MMRKKYTGQVISIEFIKPRQHHLQVCHKEERAMFTSNPVSSITFYMFINVLIKRLLTILFYFIHFILFTFQFV